MPTELFTGAFFSNSPIINGIYKSVIGIFWDEVFIFINMAKKNLDVWPLFVENEALLTCNFTS